jgi:hypothetical protein
MRLLAGPIADEYLTTDAPYSNERIKKLGFPVRHPTARTGIPAVLAGTPPAGPDGGPPDTRPGDRAAV